MTENLPEAARHLVQSIDTQLGFIVVDDQYQNDETFALAQQRQELERWKSQIIADPASVSSTTVAAPAQIDNRETGIDQVETVITAPTIIEESDPDTDNDVEPEPEPESQASSDSDSAQEATSGAEAQPDEEHDSDLDAVPDADAPDTLNQTIACSACFDRFPSTDIVQLHCCSTQYCKSCFKEWFTSALNSKELPKCCDIGIEPKHYFQHLDSDTKKKYRTVFAETDPEGKLFCSNPQCKIFIIKIEEDATGFIPCPKCGRKTCASCHQGVTTHKGRSKACAGYLRDSALNEVVKVNNWKRCPRCHVPIEKTAGCSNMRCRCGVLFCFQCGMSKGSEGAQCRCSNPAIQATEPVEDPLYENWQAPPVAAAAVVGHGVVHANRGRGGYGRRGR